VLLLRLAVPVAVAGFAAAALAGLAQTRLFSLRALAPRRRGAGPSFGEVPFALVRLTAVLTVAALTLAPHVRELPRVPLAGPAASLGWAVSVGLGLTLRLAITLVVLGAVDLVLQRRRHLRRLRMTPAEVRREHRETEGDPALRRARRERHAALLQSPTHAVSDGEGRVVALLWAEGMSAPRVAGRAVPAGVPITIDPTLCRALDALTDGDPIPARLYEPVAALIRSPS
jgi:flagellar biosynthesis protein FlhB